MLPFVFSYGKANVASCKRFWDSENAHIDKACLPFIPAIPAIIAVFILLCYCIQPWLKRRPQWSKKFAAEADHEQHQQDSDLARVKSWNLWTLCLMALSILGLVASLVSAFVPPVNPLDLLSLIPWAVLTLFTIVWRPKSTPVPLIALSVAVIACQLVFLGHADDLRRRTEVLTIVEASIAVMIFAVMLTMPLRDPSLGNGGISRPFKNPTYHLRSPEDNLTLWQFMTVSWMSPLISLGSTRQLHDEDVWLLPYEFQHTRLHILFRELKGSVVKRLLMANGVDLMTTSILGIIEAGANLSAPVLLQQLLRSIENVASAKRIAFTYTILILAVRLIACQSAVFSLWYCRRCYERSRGEMITMIYEKTLSRKVFGSVFTKENEQFQNGNGNTRGIVEPVPDSNRQGFVRKLQVRMSQFCRRSKSVKKASSMLKTPKEPASMGKILNLMRNDVYEVAQRFWEFPNIITQPMKLILSIILIWKLLGWSCLLGMVCVIAAQCINAALVRILFRWERIRRSVTDVKLQLTSQYVQAIRYLRWYDWQNQWLDQILISRQRELQLRLITGLWRLAITVTNGVASGMFPVAAFWAYTVMSRQPLRVDIAFPALQLFNMLDTSLRELPNLITVLLNASVAVGRIEDFMTEPDKMDQHAETSSTGAALEIRNGTFAWAGYPSSVLEAVNLTFPTGLTVIYGKVGEGKTALLQAILGEIDKRGGEVIHPDEMVGYCAQLPWLQSMSIRENILFSSPFDQTRYYQVLDACALIPDFANFKHGDLSNLGENGIGLSGGQRARVALARAIYSRARILLLDDPLASLDHQTAETIVNRLFRGPLMEGRTVLLVTHRIDICAPLARQLVEISNGEAHIQDAATVVAFHNITPRSTSPEPEEGETAQDLHEQQHAAVPDKFIEEEHRAEGGVMASIYWQYVKAGKLKWWILMIALFGAWRLNRLANYWFLKEWSEAYEEVQEQSIISRLFDKFPSPESNVRPWLIGFLLIALTSSIIYSLSEIVLLVIVYTAGRRLFRDVMRRVSQATFRFYDVTPVGRLMNRLTSDIGTLDGNISQQLQTVAWYTVSWVSSMVVIASVTPLFLIVSCALTAWFIFIFLRFLPTSQSLRRLEMVSLTPLMSNFGALLDGLTTVRAFRAQPHFQDRVIRVTDAFQKMDHFYWSLQAWLMYRFDALSACSTFALTLLALYNGLSPGLTAFMLTAATNFVLATHTLCKNYGQLQMDFVSVERVVELLHLEEEPTGTLDPPALWPAYGDDLVFDNVSIKYAPHLDPSLQNVSLHIPGGSTTAVIGRTGSGKSTLALAVLATILPEPGGHIYIGKMELGKVNVHTLRQRVTFVAQDPVLFPGNIRKNMDPLSEHSDFECETVLHRVLGPEWTLDKEIEAGGRNLSQGQRQLVGLGRAILRRSPIVILDEATASIDMKTAMYIQQVLREELKESTVITIAHRLEAVKDADYCIVLDKKKVADYGRATEIMAKTKYYGEAKLWDD